MNKSNLFLLKRLWKHINKRRREQFAMLLCLTFVSSLAEVVSLGAVLPFVGVLTQPEKIFTSPLLASTVKAFGISSSTDLILPLSILFALASLVAGALRLLLLWAGIHIGNAAGAELSMEVYRRTLYQSYSVHISRSSSEIISGITQKVSTATSVLVSIVVVVTSSVLFIAIMFMLLAVDPIVAAAATIIFGSAYGLIAWLTRRRLLYNSQCIAKEQTKVIRALQEGLGGIRDVLLDGTQKIYCNIYQKAILKLQQASGQNTFINQAPRYAMETLGMMLIASFVIVLSFRAGGVDSAIPILAMLALGAQRLLPLMQQLYGNWSVVMGSNATLLEVLSLLEQPLPTKVDLSEINPIRLNKYIQFDNVSFRYGEHSPIVLGSVNLSIRRGTRVGIVGTTGSGKSTALDLLMGLLEPTGGSILIDGNPLNSDNKVAWQRSVAHVPQSIFLSDASIAENIAFGVPLEEIDIGRVRYAAQQAKIADFIESRSEGYAAVVGERGVRLSGGQRQRIGIARALYKQASVLIFDEATSALDNETEKSVISSIDALSRDLTLVIVAHRLSTIKKCDVVFRISGGAVTTTTAKELLIENGEAE